MNTEDMTLSKRKMSMETKIARATSSFSAPMLVSLLITYNSNKSLEKIASGMELVMV